MPTDDTTDTTDGAMVLGQGVLERLDGVKVVLGREAGTCSVLRVIPADTPL